MKSVVDVKNVSIKYVVGDFKDIGLKEYLLRKIKGEYQIIDFLADKNITFSLNQGDMLGIIGTNGAGKSTLLKAISGVMVPTSGKINTSGKIAALLELTAGFDQDLTVKENAYLRGAMLGYSRKFMNEKYNSIIEFAELKDFQDRTFKQLSSGMKSRLAFSIACLVNPEIIILDEVLSVGDGSFKEKSGKKMREILNSGVTGILVSHSTSQVRELCNKILWLDHGKQICFSDEKDICLNAYEEYLLTKNIPKDYSEIIEMSNKYISRKKKEIEKKEEIELEKFALLLEKGNEKAIELVIETVEKNYPNIMKNLTK